MIKPNKARINKEEIKRYFKIHAEKIKRLQGRREPRPMDLARIHLEEEFEE